MYDTHGGDILTAKTKYDGALLDFSANLNPLGMPPQVAQAAMRGVEASDAYPDPQCRQLRQGIARRDGVVMEQVICGNGAADLIFRLVIAERPQKALVTAPTFSEYAEALDWVDCQVGHHRLHPQEGFALTRAILEEISPELDMLFLCTPNNPTGACIAPGLMEEILEKTAQCGVRLVVDECFLDLSTGGQGLSRYLVDYHNLFLLRAFTKSYAMAGLRLGYGLCGDENLMDRLSRCGQPWSVSTPAQQAGLAALDCPDWPIKARTLLAVERPALQGALEELGLVVYPGQANYLLFCAPGRADLKEALLARGVLIRACGNYVGLGPDYYRVCVKPRQENQRLLAALNEVL